MREEKVLEAQQQQEGVNALAAKGIGTLEKTRRTSVSWESEISSTATASIASPRAFWGFEAEDGLCLMRMMMEDWMIW
jgi:hypothetical protein